LESEKREKLKLSPAAAGSLLELIDFPPLFVQFLAEDKERRGKSC